MMGNFAVGLVPFSSFLFFWEFVGSKDPPPLCGWSAAYQLALEGFLMTGPLGSTTVFQEHILNAAKSN